jgi:hypothetical protein
MHRGARASREIDRSTAEVSVGLQKGSKSLHSLHSDAKGDGEAIPITASTHVLEQYVAVSSMITSYPANLKVKVQRQYLSLPHQDSIVLARGISEIGR